MQIYTLENQEQKGPFTIEELKARLEKGECSLETLGWHSGLKEWARVSDILLSPSQMPPLPFEVTPPSQEDALSKYTVKVQGLLNKIPHPSRSVLLSWCAKYLEGFKSLPERIKNSAKPYPLKWFDRFPVVFAGLVIFWPVGLFCVWKTKRFEKPDKWRLTLLAMIWAAVLGSIGESDKIQTMSVAGEMPYMGTTEREAMEERMANVAVKIAADCFGGRDNVLGAEAAMYSEEAGGQFPLVVYIKGEYTQGLDAFEMLVTQRNFFKQIKASGGFQGVKNVFLVIAAREFYDVYHNVPQRIPNGVLELMLPMSVIEETDWNSTTYSGLEQLLKTKGSFKLYKDGHAVDVYSKNR